MSLPLTDAHRTELEAAMTAEQRVHRWKRSRAILLRGEGLSVPAVARALGCSQASIYAWRAAWRQDGMAGLAEGAHRGGPVKLGPAAEAMLTALLASDPQTQGHRATGWMVPLLQGDLAARGTTVIRERRAHRQAIAPHRLGLRIGPALQCPFDGTRAPHMLFHLRLGVAVCLVDRLGRLAQVMELAELVGHAGPHAGDGAPDRMLAIRNDAPDRDRQRRAHVREQRGDGLLGGAQEAACQ
jgi:hypothetical protein